MLDLREKIHEAAAVIRQRWRGLPRVGVILGTGLGNFTEQILIEKKFDYDAIPHFPRSTAIGHKGQLVCGTLLGVTVAAMEGRFHIYEGYTAEQVTLPVRLMKFLGIELLIVSNASGGMNPRYRSGDIMVIEDHINLTNANPLVGINDGRPGPPRLDRCEPYDRELIDNALAIARQENFAAHKGTYVALSGPNYETRAEYRFLRQMGGDVVGMSTVHEVIVAAHLGLRVLALSTVTNMCLPDAIQASSGAEVVAMANAAEAKLRKIILGVVGAMQGTTAK
jgi:purine-nucleoside phosphorylase